MIPVKIRQSWDRFVSYTLGCETSAGCLRSIYPSLGMRQLFGDVTMGNDVTINRPNYPLELIGMYVHINTQNKESLNKDVVDRQMYNCVWYFCTYLYGLSLNGWYVWIFIANNRDGVTITTHAIKRHFPICITTVTQPTKRLCSWGLTLK